MPNTHQLLTDSWIPFFGSIPNQNQVKWKVRLPNRGALTLLATPARCFVGTSQQLLSFNIQGKLEWSNNLLGVRSLILLPDERLCSLAGNTISIHNQRTGEILKDWEAIIASAPIFTHIKTIAYTAVDRTGQRYLYHRSLDGELLWAKPLSGTTLFPPISLSSGLLIADSHLYHYSFTGEPQRIESTAISGLAGDETIIAPLLPVNIDQAQVIVDYQGAQGAKLVLHSLEKKTALSLLSPVANRPQMVIVPLDSGPGLAMKDIPIHEGPDLWQHGIMLLNLDGTTLWRRGTQSEVRVIVSDATGKLVLASSPLPEIWDTYNPVQSLAGDSYVECIGSDGESLWRWNAPGPITSTLAIGIDCLYVIVDGNLYCIGES